MSVDVGGVISATEADLLMEDEDENSVVVQGSQPQLNLSEEALLLEDDVKKEVPGAGKGIDSVIKATGDDGKSKSKPGEDDVIVLDDDNDSGVSDSKKPRKVEDELMEVDELAVITKEERESVGKIIRKMNRQDLEDLVLAKIVEGIVSHTEVGQLRAKVLELQMQKDKMASKMGIMMKQVAELSNAVTNVVENELRDPKNRLGKPHVIRFNRSVGLQTSIEPSVRTAPPKIIRVPEPMQNGMKQLSGSGSGKGAQNGSFNAPQPQGAKRSHSSGKAGGEKSTSGNTSPRKVYNSPAPQPTRVQPIAQKGTTVSPTSALQNVQPGFVDLTDDDPTPQSAIISIPVTNNTTTGTPTTFINGVQFQILNRTTAPNVQAVPTTAQKYVVTTTPQTRPVLLQQQVGTNVLRGVNNAPVTILPRQVAPPPARPANMVNANAPRVAANVQAKSSTNILGSNNPRRFVLPPLPAAPPAKMPARMSTYRLPAKPELTLNEQADGIVLSWNLPTIAGTADIVTYQIFACQEYLGNANKLSQWKRVGDVKALPLPMACTLSQFTEENRYHFIVRGIDVHENVGPFCEAQNILLRLKNK